MKTFNYTFLIMVGLCLQLNTISAQTCEGSHSAALDDSWLSCVVTPNPNTDRPDGHWILYDLGSNYELNESHFWNYNVAGETGSGAAIIAIDWSTDGINWTWWGDVNLSEAPGNDSYFGEPGPDFQGLDVNYLLLTIVSNYGGTCSGFSELKLQIVPGVVGIEELSISTFEFRLHPNPASNQTTLQIEDFRDSQIRLYSPTGNLVKTFNPTAHTSILDLNDLASGIYTVEVINGAGSRSSKRLTVIQ